MNEENKSSQRRKEPESPRRRDPEPEAVPSGSLLGIIMENSPEGIDICEYNLKTGKRKLIACNDRYVEMAGRSREELLSAEHLDPWVRDISSMGAYDPEHNEFPWRGISSWVRPDGRENYYEWTASHAVVGDDVYIIGVSRDITTGERMDEVLARGEYWFKAILDNSFDGINICKYDRRTHKRTLVLCNDQYVKMSGRSREELKAADHIGPLVEDHSYFGVHDPKFGGRPHRGISSWIRPDGKENYYEWTATYLTLGDNLYIIGVDRDITEHRRMDEALGESEYLYRTTIDAMSDPIHVVDADLRLTLFNAAFAQWCGEMGLEQEVVGSNLFEVFPFLSDKIRDEYHRVFETGEHLATEEVTSMGGRQFALDVRKVPILEAGKVVRVITVIHDITERRRINDAIRQSESRLRLILENSFDGINIAEYDPRTGRRKLVMCNDRYVEMSGRTRRELMESENLSEFVWFSTPRGGPFLEYVLKGEPSEGDASWRRPDGKENYYEWTATPLKMGDKYHIIGIDRDVTERKRSEDALRQSEVKYRTLTENLPQRIFTKDKDSVYVSCNQSYARALKINPEELVGKTDYDFSSRELAEKYIADDKRIMRSGQAENIEERFVEDGRERIVNTVKTPVKDDEGNVIGILGIFWDITEQKLAEEAIREAKEQLQRVVDNSWDLIFQLDVEGNFEFCNRAAERITGYAQDELLRMNERDLLAPECLQLGFERIRMHIAGKPVEQPVVVDILRKDGQQVSLEAADSELKRDGKLVAILTVARDITKRKLAEEAVRAAQHKLMAAREYERRRLARDLHDTAGQRAVALHYAVQNVLTRSGERLGAELTEQLEKVSHGCSEVIRELRQISHGLYPPTLESLGLTATLRQLARDAHGGTMVTVSCPEAIESVRFGEEVEIALFRIAQEALNNALRHSKANRVELRLEHKAGRLGLTVTDNGSGFSPRKTDGTGLGLTSMRERAQAIGGELDISSRKGNTRVRVTVPADGSR